MQEEAPVVGAFKKITYKGKVLALRRLNWWVPHDWVAILHCAEKCDVRRHHSVLFHFCGFSLIDFAFVCLNHSIYFISFHFILYYFGFLFCFVVFYLILFTWNL